MLFEDERTSAPGKGEILMTRSEVYKPPVTYPRVVNLTGVSQGPHWLNDALFMQYILNRAHVYFACGTYRPRQIYNAFER